MSKLKTIDVEGFSKIDKTMISQVINHFGTDEHPYVDSDNVHYCGYDYCLECIEKAVSSDSLTELVLESIKRIKTNIQNKG